jgi:hypothetical protein
MSFLSDIASAQAKLSAVPKSSDRSEPNTNMQGLETLPDEDKTREQFFNSGVESWLKHIEAVTFATSSCQLTPSEAAAIVEHREARAALLSQGKDPASAMDAAKGALQQLSARLDGILATQNKNSPAGKSFVKLSTRSPKDSSIALGAAAEKYRARVTSTTSTNDRWCILSEEVARAGAVSTSSSALDLLLTSERVFEDLKYALEGKESNQEWKTTVCARAWDPRITIQSEFRGICWGGKLTCLCQYFHPLLLSGLKDSKADIERSILATMALPGVQSALQELGNNAIIDFAYLGPGEVLVIELNPFDGQALGCFPASTGLFLWENEEDQKVMRGEAAFEFRIREQLMSEAALYSTGNPQWRDIIRSSSRR